jgi:leader peptidase (prepilin peptidase)/N-methyltransferase
VDLFDMTPFATIACFAFIFGACIGSFLNVCIYRLPAGLSIVHPPSACPHCGNRIRFYDNLPIISYLLLRGRCRFCGARIAWRYPAVEFIAGAAALAVLLKYDLTLAALIYFTFIAALLVITFIDLDHQIIPDVISLPGIVFFFLAGRLIPGPSWIASLGGILVGGGSLLAIILAYAWITGGEGMGGGDVKLLAMIGALLAWQGVLFTIFFSSVLGTLVGLPIAWRSGRRLKAKLPFGPFLSLGAVAYIFFGPQLIALYLGLAAGPG